MKRKYTKPVLVVESFQLDVGIANCSSDNAIPINYAEDSCKFIAGDAVYFSKSCPDDIVTPGEFGDKYCYHGFNNNAGIVFISS